MKACEKLPFPAWIISVSLPRETSVIEFVVQPIFLEVSSKEGLKTFDDLRVHQVKALSHSRTMNGGGGTSGGNPG